MNPAGQPEAMSLSVSRGDLETVRTMADQMRRREKLRKQGLASWKAGLQTHLASAPEADKVCPANLGCCNCLLLYSWLF